MVVGSGSSTLAGADGASAAYPARLEFYLGQKLPGVTVHVGTDLHMRQSAEDVAQAFLSLALARNTTGAFLPVDGGNLAAAPR